MKKTLAISIINLVSIFIVCLYAGAWFIELGDVQNKIVTGAEVLCHIIFGNPIY